MALHGNGVFTLGAIPLVNGCVKVFTALPHAYLLSKNVPCISPAVYRAELMRFIGKNVQNMQGGSYENSDSIREPGRKHDVDDTKFHATVRAGVRPSFLHIDMFSFASSYEQIRKLGSIENFLSSYDVDLELYY
jgi:hypothetical protein